MPDLKLWEAAFERCKAEFEAVNGEMDRLLEEARVEAEEGRESQKLRLLEVTVRRALLATQERPAQRAFPELVAASVLLVEIAGASPRI